MKNRYLKSESEDPSTRRVFLLTRFLNTFCRHNPVTTTGRPAGERGEAKPVALIHASAQEVSAKQRMKVVFGRAKSFKFHEFWSNFAPKL